MAKIETSYEMEVEIAGDEYHPPTTITEPVPDYLNFKSAPDISSLPAVDRAKATVDWFNDTRRGPEPERTLLVVRKVTKETLFRARS